MKNAVVISTIALALNFAPGTLAADAKSSLNAVFVMTNAANHNEVVSFQRQADGTLKQYGNFRTGGRGSGGTTDPLGSQGSLTLSQDHALLFAVNEGSGDISSFRVDGANLELADVKPSGGSAPVAVAEHGGVVYVVNVAGDNSVVGFKVDDGLLRPINGSLRYLTTSSTGAGSLAFSPNGDFLLVTEKLTNNIDVFPVKSDGTLGPIVVTKDAAAGLFAVAFAPDGAALTVETGGGTISSFLVEPTGMMTALSAAVPTMGAATCWHAVTPNGIFVYTANSASSTISGYRISGAGALTPLSGTIMATLPAGTTDVDMAVSGDGKYLYTLNAGTGTIAIFAIKTDGTLKSIGTVPALAAMAGQNGIAAL